MPLHVKLIAEDVLDPCAKCGRFGDVFVFSVFVEGGSDKTEAICTRCLEVGADVSASVEPPDLSPGRRAPSRRIRKRTDKEEYELAALSGGKRQKGSGALPFAKGDFHRKGVYRGESKTCFGKDPSWTLDELTKIRSEAAYGEVPVLVTTFMDKATHEVKERWATIPFENWQEKYAPRDDQ